MTLLIQSLSSVITVVLPRDTLFVVKSLDGLTKAADEQWFENKILIAFTAAIFTQLLVVLITYVNRKIDLNYKRQMILADLAEKKRLLNIEWNELSGLKKQLEANGTSQHSSVYQYELNSNVFDSVTKPELFKIFGHSVIPLSNIYNSIDHLRDHGAKFIFVQYIEWHDGVKNSKHEPAIEKENLSRIMTASIKNCSLCLDHVTGIIDEINKIIGVSTTPRKTVQT